jgi:glycine/D-amino acid oxidase-like deaminating enzyme
LTETERHEYDVLVIGAGGAGLRAAIAARERGLRTAIVCKSLFGKAHTVMAEGGCAAAMGNVAEKDSWQVHFRDTMRGGKFLNNWRMAELHAKEAPDRVWEPHAGRSDQPAQLRRSHLPAARARRRPYRPRAPPYPPAARRGAAAGRLLPDR